MVDLQGVSGLQRVNTDLLLERTEDKETLSHGNTSPRTQVRIPHLGSMSTPALRVEEPLSPVLIYCSEHKLTVIGEEGVSEDESPVLLSLCWPLTQEGRQHEPHHGQGLP